MEGLSHVTNATPVENLLPIAPKRRKSGYTRAGIASAVSLATLAAFGPEVAKAQVAPTFNVTDLGTLGGTTVNGPAGINDTAQVVGRSYLTGSTTYSAFIYSAGTMQSITMPSNSVGTYSDARGINASGQVTGNYNTSGAQHGYIYSGGAALDIGTLVPGSSSAQVNANAINSSGQVVGGSDVPTGQTGGAFLYTGGTMQNLGALSGGTFSTATGINDSGQITGYGNTSTSSGHAFLYSSGSMQDLGTLGGSASFGYGINAAGQVTGGAYNTSGTQHAFLYSGGAMQDLGTLGGTTSVGNAINSSGQITGQSTTSGGSQHAFIYTNGVMSDLNSLDTGSSLAPYVTLTVGEAINSGSSIVADGVDSRTHQTHAYLLTPIISVALAKTMGGLCSYPGKCQAGEPIDVATGNVFEQVTDYQSGGLNKLSFVRTYNSLQNAANAGTLATTLGKNWRSNYDGHLKITSSGGTVTSIAAERPDGQVLTFVPNGSGGYSSDTDVDVSLTKSGSVWTLKDHNDVTETYNDLGTGQALLSSITQRNGYAQNLTYNGSNQLTTVMDSYARSLSLTYSGGLLNTVTTPGGLVLTYGYNSSGVSGSTLDRLASVSYNTSPATSQTYSYGNSSFPFALTSVTDENGHVASTWGYDTSGRGISNQRATVGTQQVDLTTLAYNSNGTVTVTNPLGEQETYAFSTLQGVPKVSSITRTAMTGIPAASETFGYDTNGYVNSKTDWNGNTTTYVNNVRGQPTSIAEASGTPVARTTTITYDPTFVHLPSTITEPTQSSTRTTTITYDTSGNLHTSTVTDNATSTSRTWTYTWNGTGELLTAQDPRSNTTTMTYSSGNLATITDALSHVTNFTSYDADGRLKLTADPNGLPTAFTYDLRGNLLTQSVGSTATTGGTQVTTLVRDAAENITQVTKPDSSSLTYTLDAANRVTVVTNSLSEHTNYTLDAAGNATAVNIYDSTSTLNRSHTFAFDALNRLKSDTDAYSNTTTYGYDNNGNRTSVTDPLSEMTAYAYDQLNRVKTVTNPLSNATTIGYTADTGNLPYQVTSPRGLVTQYTYDGFKEVTQLSSPDSGLTNYTYDAAGNVATKLDGNGNLTTYNTYDALNRLKKATYQDGTISNYYYDNTGAIGRIKQIADPTQPGKNANTTYINYDLYGNVTQKQNVYSSQLYQASYNPTTGQLASETYPSGMVIGYLYDAAGQQKQINLNGSPFIAHATHQPMGGPALAWDWVSNNGHYTRTFDLNGRLATYPLASDTRTVGYDNASRVNSLTDSVASQSIGYDADSRVTSYTGPYGNGTQTLTYDNDGNRNGITAGGATESYSIDPTSNRITSRTKSGTTTPYTYDGVGNTTAEGAVTTAYDVRNRATSVTNTGNGKTTAWFSDGLDERLTMIGSGGASHYAWAATGKSITGRWLGEYASTTNANYNEIIMLDGTLPVGGAPVGGTTETRDTALRIFSGHLNEPRRATDNHANLYWTWDSDVFGVGAQNPQPSGTGFASYYQVLRFPGQIYDYQSSTHYNVTRSYVPARGRYYQPDSIGLNGGPNDYAYVNNNPANNVDMTGRASTFIGGVSGGVSGGALGGPLSTILVGARGGFAGGALTVPSSTVSAGATGGIIGGAGSIPTGSVVVTFGGMGNRGLIGAGADSGVGFDSTGNVCLVADACQYYGENTPAGGGLGVSAQVSNGVLCSGASSSKGVYFYGGEGLLGEGQITVSDDGSVGVGRGLIGYGRGGGGGRVICQSQTLCLK